MFHPIEDISAMLHDKFRYRREGEEGEKRREKREEKR